jgi:hypothetical protein
MTAPRPQFKPLHTRREAAERKKWLDQARRADLIEALNQPEQLEALHQRMAQAQQTSEEEGGRYDIPME